MTGFESLTERTLGGRYRLERELGQGGMAVVYVAYDERDGRRVAVKILRPELARILGPKRFLQEVRLAAELSHPNLLPLVDSGEEDGLFFYVMPVVSGGTLRDRLRREGQLPVDETLRITRDIAAGLWFAHEARVVHRDIKPENILLDGLQVLIADFGIARVIAASGIGVTTMSSAGLTVGTPAYMSPEQAAGQGGVDGRSDLYSLGCVLYEMLTGAPPFSGATPQALAARHMFEAPPSIRVVRGTVPPWIEAVAQRCLAKVPADRYPTAADLVAVLERGPPLVRVDRRAGLKLLAAAAVLVLIAYLWFATRPVATRLDPRRYAILPFRTPSESPPAILSGINSSFLVYEALAPFRDISLVDRARLESFSQQLGPPKALADAFALARRLGAGRLLWGEVVPRGDSVVVRAQVYQVEDVIGDPMSRAAFTLATGPLLAGEVHAGQLFRSFVRLARELVVPQAGTPDAFIGTEFTSAVAAKLAGDSARVQWDLDVASERYRAALAIDPNYQQARVSLAQMASWVERPLDEWRPLVRAAVQARQSLSERDFVSAEALLALADADYPRACDRYRHMVARDSLDFDAWFGLGECQAGDPGVAAVAASASGYAFRSSFEAASQAYARALHIVPLAHRAAREMASERLLRVLRTAPWLRSGKQLVGEGPAFLAWPSLDADTIAFVPYPWSRFTGPNPPPQPASMQSLFARNATLLAAYTAEWTGAFPSSSEAWGARAAVFEKMGRLEGDSAESALGAVRRARALATKPDSRLRWAAAEVQLLTKLGRFPAALRLADSIVKAAAPRSSDEALRLAALATFTGRLNVATRLIRRGADAWPFSLSSGESVAPPLPLAEDALELYLYAMLGGSVDTLSALERRVVAQVDAWTPKPRRFAFLAALMAEPALYGFPTFGERLAHRLDGASASLVTQRRLARGRPEARTDVERMATIMERRPASENAAETVHLEAFALLRLGDTARAVALLKRAVGSLESAPSLLFATPQGPAFLVKNVKLLATLSGEPADQLRAASITLR